MTFTFDKGAQRLKINPGIFKRSTQPIDADSVFTFDNNDQLEYRRGLNGSVFGYGIKFSMNPKKPWDNAHVTALVAALINGLTEWLNSFLPIDLAKAVTVIAFYLVAMTVIKYLPQHLERGLTRAFVVLAILLFVTASVAASDDHITASSFWFGDYVVLIERYF